LERAIAAAAIALEGEEVGRTVGAAEMMPLETYLRARRNAQHHVQVLIERIEFCPSALPGDVRVGGCVARVFRTTGSLAVGDRVSFAVAAIRDSDDPPTGGVWWTGLGSLTNARFLEAFFHGEPPNVEIAAWQSRVINELADEPLMLLDAP
jgi:hypothetical protein